MKTLSGAEKFKLKLKVFASSFWLVGCWIGGGFYVHGHGFDIAALAVWLIGLLPAWPLIAEDVDLAVLGQHFRVKTISGEAVEKATSAVVEGEPEAVKLVKGKASAEASSQRDAIQAVQRILPHPTNFLLDTNVLHALGKPVREIYVPDPNLLLVNLRIEIERRLRAIAELVNVKTTQPLALLLRDLKRQEVLPGGFADGLERLIKYGNDSAHGAQVEPGIALQLLSSQDSVLRVLDDIIVALEEQMTETLAGGPHMLHAQHVLEEYVRDAVAGTPFGDEPLKELQSEDFGVGNAAIQVYATDAAIAVIGTNGKESLSAIGGETLSDLAQRASKHIYIKLDVDDSGGLKVAKSSVT